MPSDLRIPLLAKVDIKRVSFLKKKSLGIEFSNEIDLWAKMKFRASKQLHRMKSNSSLNESDMIQDTSPLIYAMREKID